MDEAKLLEFIKTQIETITSKITESTLASEKELTEIQKMLVERDQLTLIRNMFDILSNNYGVLEDKELQELNVFKIFLESGVSSLELTQQNMKKLELYSQKLFYGIRSKREKIAESEKKDKDVAANLLELERKITTKNEVITVQEFEWFLNYLKNHEMPYSEKIELISTLGNIETVLYFEQVQKQNNSEESYPDFESEESEEIEFVEENTINIDEQDLFKLFQEYGYNFELLNSHQKKELSKFGNLENIENIFKTFKEWDINPKIFEDKIKSLTKLLIGSNPNIVNTIIQNIKIDFDASGNKTNQDFYEILSNYISVISNWVLQTKQFVKKGQTPIEIHGNKIPGTFRNYEENRRFFNSIGLNMNYVMSKCPSISCNNPNSVKYGVACFDFYGIPKEVYFAKLSALEKKNPLDAIDRFIELGYYEYISRYLTTITSPGLEGSTFYRLKQANQQGKSVYASSKGSLKQFKQIITKPKLNLDDPDDKVIIMKDGALINNGPQAVGEYNYFESSKELKEYYDSVEPLVKQSKNIGPLKLIHNSPFIKNIEMRFASSKDPKVYNINGVIISRLKVLRIYETLLQNNLGETKESMEYAIFRNSILTEKEVTKVLAGINPITKVAKKAVTYEKRR